MRICRLLKDIHIYSSHDIDFDGAQFLNQARAAAGMHLVS